MTEQEIHEWIQLKLQDPRQQAEPSPPDISKEKWKNRHKVSAKLHRRTYDSFIAWCRDHELSVNQAINVVLSFFLSQTTNHDECDLRRTSGTRS